MKKLFALVVATAMGLSSVAFAAETTTAPATTPAAPAKVEHKAVHHKHKKTAAKKLHKKAVKPADQKAQAAKKHHKKAVKSATK